MIFSTDRMEFRRLTLEDFDSLYRMYSDREIREFFPDGVLDNRQTLSELNWHLHGHPDDPRLGLWAAIFKSDGSFVGRCGLLPWEIDAVPEIEIAYMIDKPFWRMGLGSEAARGLVRHAFETFEANRLIALTDPYHVASIRTAQAAGLNFWKTAIVENVESSVYKIDRNSWSVRHSADDAG